MRYSVIIPIYNAEKTLKKCLDSLLCQDYSDMELILINDGSVDGSDQICREYAGRSKRVTYIAKDNGGVSSARNAGLDAALGQYVTFVDSDDYVSADYFSQLDAILAHTTAEYIMFSHCTESKFGNEDFILSNLFIHEKSAFYKKAGELIYTKKINSPCNKVYLRSHIEKFHIRFPVDIAIGEDRFFNLHYILGCSSIYSCDKLLYIANLDNENSLSRGIRKDLHEQFRLLRNAIEVLLNQEDIEPEFYQRIREALDFGVIGSVYSDIKRMYITGKSRRERQTMIRSRCKEINQMELALPDSKYCRLLAIPVRLRLVMVIDALAWYLAHR